MWCRGVAAGSLTDRRSQHAALARSLGTQPWRSALSTVGTPRATAGPRRTHDGRQTRLASRAVIRRHLEVPSHELRPPAAG